MKRLACCVLCFWCTTAMAEPTDPKTDCVKEAAQAAYKKLIQDPKTNEALKTVLKRVIDANPGTSREEIVALFESEKKLYNVNLQRQALASGQEQCMSH